MLGARGLSWWSSFCVNFDGCLYDMLTSIAGRLAWDMQGEASESDGLGESSEGVHGGNVGC